MAELMTSEAIIEAEWILMGYWSKPRYAFQTDKGAWSDVDVLSYDPEKKHLVISESKVQGHKNVVFAYTAHSKENYGSILEYDNDVYFSFLRHLKILCKDGVIFNNIKLMVNLLTVQLVCNYVVSKNMKSHVDTTLKKAIISHDLPVKVEFQLDTTLDVISRIVEKERESGQGRRYGHPVLDIAREINRYFYPNVRYAGHDSESVKNEAIENFLKSLGKQI